MSRLPKIRSNKNSDNFFSKLFSNNLHHIKLKVNISNENFRFMNKKTQMLLMKSDKIKIKCDYSKQFHSLIIKINAFSILKTAQN